MPCTCSLVTYVTSRVPFCVRSVGHSDLKSPHYALGNIRSQLGFVYTRASSRSKVEISCPHPLASVWSRENEWAGGT